MIQPNEWVVFHNRERLISSIIEWLNKTSPDLAPFLPEEVEPKIEHLREGVPFRANEIDAACDKIVAAAYNDTLSGLMSQGLIECGVRNDGEIVWWTTPEQKERIKKIEGFVP